MQRKTKSVIACGMAAALMLTTLGMENEVSAKAVSYTHLDVYKRQICNVVFFKQTVAGFRIFVHRFYIGFLCGIVKTVEV